VGVSMRLLLSHGLSMSHMCHTFVLCVAMFVSYSCVWTYTSVTRVTRNSIKSAGKIVCWENGAYRGFLRICV
jgi:hypothetical protein